ncbi:hypothetical protein HYH03_017906 [Edaphochlamys debaryana]|uniref:Uncharacterized protein n=1 Tax=Edaphochlamys debaryana TaxID=47281 RepID=A0A836BQ32_9CHLO|nr:hypothetical protein HYH03_017906 [Edaphochlamys debaryana]|eukprot:KAG2483208.1 hypothetical protein HYH03_017906 [Edaphochlamys debaryana]
MARQPRFQEYLQALNHPCANYAKRLYRLRACLANSSSSRLTIDASPMYVEWPLTPITLRAISTQSKVIVMLRDPLARIESLYVHRTITEHLWTQEPIDSVYDSFFNTGRKSPEVLICLHRLRRCRNDTRCMEDGWRDLVTAGYMNDYTMQLFATGLYRYILAPWRRHYFQRNRVLIIDSHAYYASRTAVMEQVIAFLYGRAMTEAERKLAEGAEVKLMSQHTVVEGQPRPAWVLSHDRMTRLKAFLKEHVLDGMYEMLQELRNEGAWVVGFDKPPWPWAV